MTQEDLDSLSPLRHLIDVTVQSVEPSRDSSSSNATKMKEQWSKELKLVVSQVWHWTRLFYSPSVSLVFYFIF